MAASPIKCLDRHCSTLAIVVQPTSPRFPPFDTPTSSAQRRIGIAVDLSDESTFVVTGVVQSYLRHNNAVVLLHFSPTFVLYGVEWCTTAISVPDDEASHQNFKSDFDNFTVTANDSTNLLDEARIPYKIPMVKKWLCLEVERLQC